MPSLITFTSGITVGRNPSLHMTTWSENDSLKKNKTPICPKIPVCAHSCLWGVCGFVRLLSMESACTNRQAVLIVREMGLNYKPLKELGRQTDVLVGYAGHQPKASETHSETHSDGS